VFLDAAHAYDKDAAKDVQSALEYASLKSITSRVEIWCALVLCMHAFVRLRMTNQMNTSCMGFVGGDAARGVVKSSQVCIEKRSHAGCGCLVPSHRGLRHWLTHSQGLPLPWFASPNKTLFSVL
jgi:hypothetical protein